ncbi:MAG: T9SS type A sorting domain-containing protein [Bacteroidota bacterium]
MMPRTLFAMLGVLFAYALPAQNLMPNPGFETVSSCPTNISQFDGYVGTWTSANAGTTDYGACTHNGNTSIRITPATGNAAAGMWGGAAHSSCGGSAYVESIKAPLSATLIPGQLYDVEVMVMIDGIGSSTNAPNNCLDFGMYFYNSASPPPASGVCCVPVTPQWSVPANTLPQGTYQILSGTISAGTGWNSVIVGPFCNGNTTSVGCSDYLGTRMYFNLDNVMVQLSSVLEIDLTLDGSAFDRFHQLEWEMPEGTDLREFQLEWSVDGEHFVGLTDLFADGKQAFSYRHDAPEEGRNYYRLTGTSQNGAVGYSNVIELQHALTAPARDETLHFHFDQRAETIRFSMEEADAGNYTFELLDMRGQQVMTQQWQKTAGHQRFEVPVAGISAGMYVVRLRTAQQFWQNKFLR